MAGKKDCIMFIIKPLRFLRKSVSLAYLTPLFFCLSLLCDLAIHLARVYSVPSPKCSLVPSSFPKPFSPSLWSGTSGKRFESHLFLTYSMILLLHNLLKTCTKPCEDLIANEMQFLILHCLNPATQPNITGNQWVFSFSAAECCYWTSSQLGLMISLSYEALRLGYTFSLAIWRNQIALQAVMKKADIKHDRLYLLISYFLKCESINKTMQYLFKSAECVGATLHPGLL